MPQGAGPRSKSTFDSSAPHAGVCRRGSGAVSSGRSVLSSAEPRAHAAPLRERGDKKPLIRHIFAQESAATPAVSLSGRPGGYAVRLFLAGKYPPTAERPARDDRVGVPPIGWTSRVCRPITESPAGAETEPRENTARGAVAQPPREGGGGARCCARSTSTMATSAGRAEAQHRAYVYVYLTHNDW